MSTNQKGKPHKPIKNDESILDSVQERFFDGLWRWNIENPESEWANPQLLFILGYTPIQQFNTTNFNWQDLINLDDLKIASDNLKKHLLDPDYPYDQQIRFTHKNGSTIWVHSKGYAERNNSGDPIKMLGFHQDITELKNTQLKLEEARNTFEKKHLALFENAPHAYQTIDNKGIIIEVNTKWLEILGYKKESVIGLNFIDFIHPNSINTFKANFKKLITTKKQTEVEYRLKHKSGNSIYALFKSCIVLDQFGNFSHTYCSFNDITVQKESELNIKRERDLYETVINSIPSRVFWKDLDSKYIGCNKNFAEDAGVSSIADVIGKSDNDLIWKEDAEKFRADDKQVIQTGKPKINYNEHFNDSSGNTVSWKTNKMPLVNSKDQIIGVLAIAENITEELKLTNKLKESEERFKNIFEQSPLAIQIYDKHGKLININKETLNLFGLKNKEQILGYDLWQDPHLTPKLKKLLKAGLPVTVLGFFDTEAPTDFNPEPNSNQGVKYLDMLVFPLYTEEELTGYLVQISDITKSKIAQEELKHNERKFKSVFNYSNIGIILSDNKGVITDVNYEFLKMSGFKKEKVIGYRYGDIRTKDSENERRIYKKFIKKEINHFRLEKRLEKKDGSYIWLDTAVTARRDENGNIDMFVLMLIDITKSKKNKESLKKMYHELKTVYDNDPSYLFFKDTKNNIIKVNNAVVEATGLSKEQIEGKHESEIYPPDIANKYYQTDLEVINSGKIKRNYLNPLYHVSGEVRWTYTTKIPIKENGKDVSGILVVSTDVTELKQNQERLKVAIEGANLGTWEWNIKTGEVYTSKYWIEQLGFTEEEFTPSIEFWNSLVHYDDIERSNNIMKEHLQGETNVYSDELRIKNKAGEWIWVYDNGKIVEYDNEGKPLIVSGIILDITKRKESEKQVKLLGSSVEQSPIASVITNKKGMIEYINPAFTKITGYTTDDVKGKTPRVLKSGRQNLKFYENLWNTITSNNKWSGELLNEKKNGELYWSDLVISPIVNSKNEITNFVAVSEDITNKKNQEQRIQLLGRGIQQSPVAVFVTNKNGNIEYINPAFTNITGYSFKDIKGKTPQILNSGTHSKTFYENLWGTISNKKKWIGETKNKKKNGELYWSSLVISPIVNPNDEITHFVAVSEDVTSKKVMIDDLITAKDKAEEANRLKTEFLNNISHEVRTPMNGILGFTEYLGKPDLDDEKRLYYSSIVKNSGQQLLRIIDDLIEISTIETKQIKVSKKLFCLDDFLMELKTIYDLKSKEKNIPLRFIKPEENHDIYIETDKSKLHKIISNLLDNAFKFTKNGFIELGYYINPENNSVVLYIKDTGKGIEQKNIERIFERFVQEDKSITQNYGGLGLGLSIAKENTQLLGGKLTLLSQKEKGSIFYVTLPENIKIVETNNQINKPTKNNKTDKEFITILIAEDENLNFIILKTLLLDSNSKYKIKHAFNGQEAVDICNNEFIDIVLMDINMPIKNGYEATTEIKRKYPKLPIVAQTAYSLEDDVKKAFDAGVDDLIPKPIDKKLLIKTVKKYLNVK